MGEFTVMFKVTNSSPYTKGKVSDNGLAGVTKKGSTPLLRMKFYSKEKSVYDTQLSTYRRVFLMVVLL